MMLDVKIGSIACFLLYALQVGLPLLKRWRLGGWYTNHKLIADEAVSWGTNMFWGYVGFRVLNPGLYGGVLIYLLVMGIARVIIKIRETEKDCLLNAFSSMANQMSGWSKIGGSSIHSYRKGDELEIVVDIPDARFQYFLHLKYRDIWVEYWEVDSFPTSRKLILALEEYERKLLNKLLKRGNVVKVIEEIIPTLKNHSARQ